MKRILVGIKRVVDYNVRVRVKPDGSGVVTDGVKMSINPFDEIALEEALRIKERGGADRSRSSSPPSARRTPSSSCAPRWPWARTARCSSRAPPAVEPLDAAQVFLKLVEKEQPFLVILGKQAIDDDNNQTGQMLAALWNRPQATFASKLELAGTRPPSRAKSTRASRRSKSICPPSSPRTCA